jgi:hypothetical protein
MKNLIIDLVTKDIKIFMPGIKKIESINTNKLLADIDLQLKNIFG